jgi:hypothetical protein
VIVLPPAIVIVADPPLPARTLTRFTRAPVGTSTVVADVPAA